MLALFQFALFTAVAVALIGVLVVGFSSLLVLGVMGAIAGLFVLALGLLFKLLMLPFILFSPLLLLIAAPALIVWMVMRRKRRPSMQDSRGTVIDI